MVCLGVVMGETPLGSQAEEMTENEEAGKAEVDMVLFSVAYSASCSNIRW